MSVECEFQDDLAFGVCFCPDDEEVGGKNHDETIFRCGKRSLPPELVSIYTLIIDTL